MKKYIIFFLWLMSLGFAQEVVTQPVIKIDDITALIGTSTQELLLVTDVFRNEELSDAVREAITKRGVQVYVLAPRGLLADLSSYFGTLAQAGAAIHTQESTGAFLVIDRKYVVQGSLLGSMSETQGTTHTMLVVSPEYADHLATLFIDAFEGGEAWTYEPQ